MFQSSCGGLFFIWRSHGFTTSSQLFTVAVAPSVSTGVFSVGRISDSCWLPELDSTVHDRCLFAACWYVYES